MKHFLRHGCFFFLLAFAACKDITHVQTGYVADRDQCRGNAENNVGVYSQPESYPLNDKERNTALLQLFCECMKEKDWKVAGCPKPPVVVAATPAPAPTVVVVQSPTSQPAILPAPAPVTAAAQVHRGHARKCTVPQNTCSAPNASYQPATPLQEDQQLQGILQRQ